MDIIAHKKQTIKECLEENHFSRHIIRNMKKALIMVNGKEKHLWEFVLPNDLITIVFNDEHSTIIPIKGNINIVYEDDYIIIVNKPAKQASMPNRGHYENSLANYVKYYFEEHNINNTIHLVNRLDYETSGLVLIAKNKLMHGLLSKCHIIKKYYAVVEGIITSGVIEKPIMKDGCKRVVGGTLTAKTEYKVLKKEKNSLLDINLLTGRTHQIRVHMAYLNHPVIGDNLYGNGQDLALQSYFLKFMHPIINKEIICELPLEERLERQI